ncbi:hypothetical protein P700755_000257 [Psychroflexus torquis ATCC 700755]|uniref:Uncharacterized protein n=1 Tax=Psychroflexus torquis (strain ATCC 700755 / CIP 106069 / ACAM 623) TaxID=313595 RepID=K4IP34_PSYTT|nr:hypothetical protein P700755_000257 [Psychroflexus torquis ATCC 700755]
MYHNKKIIKNDTPTKPKNNPADKQDFLAMTPALIIKIQAI